MNEKTIDNNLNYNTNDLYSSQDIKHLPNHRRHFVEEKSFFT